MDQLDRVHERIAGRFVRSEPRARAREYVSGLVAGLERKNGWTLAEQAGEVSPDGMQRLLRWADWNIDGVRDDLRDYVVVEHLGEPGGVLIVDDTGFLKKGTRSAGVQRQYSGTAGRIENCQIGTFLAYAGARGHALIDRELYLPEPWIADRDRCRRAGIPEGTEFETKPRQAMAMLARVFATEVPFAWVTADEAYGQVKYLRLWLEAHDAAHVLATKVNDTLVTTGGREARADELIAGLPARSWRRLSVGAGAHGGPASATGRGCRSGSAGDLGAGTGCSPAVHSRIRPRSPTTSATDLVARRCWIWPGSPAPGGGSRSVSSRLRTKPDSTTTRSVPGGPGMPTSPSRCSLTPGSRSPDPLS